MGGVPEASERYSASVEQAVGEKEGRRRGGCVQCSRSDGVNHTELWWKKPESNLSAAIEAWAAQEREDTDVWDLSSSTMSCSSRRSLLRPMVQESDRASLCVQQVSQATLSNRYHRPHCVQ